MKNNIDNNDSLVLYTLADIKEIFRCGKTKAYEIMHQKGFPSFKIGSTLYVSKQALQAWLSKQK